jgi:hypothetical protein
MAHRKPPVQRRFRLQKELLGRLERDAKRHDHSLNDEVGRRLEDSFRYEAEHQAMAEERQRLTKERERIVEERKKLVEERENFAEERQQLLTAMMFDIRSHPNPKATRTVLGVIEEGAERDFQNNPDFKEILSGEKGES